MFTGGKPVGNGVLVTALTPTGRSRVALAWGTGGSRSARNILSLGGVGIHFQVKASGWGVPCVLEETTLSRLPLLSTPVAATGTTVHRHTHRGNREENEDKRFKI